MIAPVPSIKVSAGLIRGHACPIDGTQFVSQDGSRAIDQQNYMDQEQHTHALMFELDRRYGPKSSVTDYRALMAQYRTDQLAEQEQQ